MTVIDLAKHLIGTGQELVNLATELQRWRELGEALKTLAPRYPTLESEIQASIIEERAAAARAQADQAIAAQEQRWPSREAEERDVEDGAAEVEAAAQLG